MNAADATADAVLLLSEHFVDIAPPEFRFRPGDCFAVIDVFGGRTDLAFFDEKHLDTAISHATGWSREGEMDLRAMPRQEGALRLLVVDDHGWRTSYLIMPSPKRLNAQGGEA